MQLFFRLCLSGLLIYLFSPPLFASSAYITDSFHISIRRGPTTEHKILRFLPSGQPVKILEEKEGWSRIQTLESEDEQISGWILTRYLIHRPPYENQVALLTDQNTNLQRELSENQEARKTAEEKVSELEKALLDIRIRLKETQASLEQLTRDSSGYLALRQSCADQKKTLENLLQENTGLRTQTRQQSLMIGGGLVFGGLFLGFMWGRREKNRYSGRLL